MKKYTKLLLGGSCWLIFAIFLLGVQEGARWIQQLDRWGYQLLQPTTTVRTWAFTIITHLGDPMILLPLALLIWIIFWWRHQFIRGLRFAGLQFVGYLLVIAVKYSIQRPRPDHKLIPAHGFSFPSGHTFATTVFVLTIMGFLWPHLRKHWQRIIAIIIAGGWIMLVMASRVYLRNHFTSDVFAGLCLSSGWWLLATAALQKATQHKIIGS